MRLLFLPALLLGCVLLAAPAGDRRPADAQAPAAVAALPGGGPRRADGPTLAPAEPITQGFHVFLAAQHLCCHVPRQDWHRCLFVSFYAADELDLARRVGWFWVHSLSREAAITIPREVPGSDGRLFLLYIDDYGWTRQAVNTMVRREPFFTADAVGHCLAQQLRQMVGFPHDCHAGAIISAEWLIADTSDTTQSTGYYDLLYARERWHELTTRATTTPQNSPPRTGTQYPAAKASAPSAGGARDFPETEADFQFAWGAEQAVKLSFDPQRRLEVDRGVIVDEGDSIVAYHTRLLVRVRTPVGAYHKTHDSKTSAGGKDLAEFRNLRGTVRYDQLKIDAAELITNNPAGGQVYLLANGAGKRQEFADPLTIARDPTDAYRPVVRTPRSCVICHARGINPPRNMLQAGVDAGIQLKILDPELDRRARALLLTPTAQVLSEDQGRYIDFLKRTSGLGPEQNAAAFQRLLARYEAKLDTERMAREAGLTPAALQDLARRLPAFRGQAITQGLTVPRSVWEQDVYPELMRLRHGR